MVKSSEIFISYTSANTVIATKVYETTKAINPEARIFFDKADLQAGTIFPDRIMRALLNSQILIVIISKDSLHSAWVQYETGFFIFKSITERWRRVIPIRVDDLVTDQEIEHFIPFLIQYEYISIAPPHMQEGLEKIKERISDHRPHRQVDHLPSTPHPRRRSIFKQMIDIFFGNEFIPTLSSLEPATWGDIADLLGVYMPDTFAMLHYKAYTWNHKPVIIPPMQRIEFSGEFLMGSDYAKDRYAATNEPLHPIKIEPYECAIYPVTVAEYWCGVLHGEVEAPPDLRSEPSWAQQQARIDHPVVGITWMDAMEYAIWLQLVTGIPWRLLNEAEWEFAARGAQGLIYPWGDIWQPSLANTLECSLRQTVSVGSYRSVSLPHGHIATDQSPWGCHDMAGNVTEWVSSVYLPGAYQRDSLHEHFRNSIDLRSARGGAMFSYFKEARAAARVGYDPQTRLDSLGMRLGHSIMH